MEEEHKVDAFHDDSGVPQYLPHDIAVETRSITQNVDNLKSDIRDEYSDHQLFGSFGITRAIACMASEVKKQDW